MKTSKKNNNGVTLNKNLNIMKKRGNGEQIAHAIALR